MNSTAAVLSSAVHSEERFQPFECQRSSGARGSGFSFGGKTCGRGMPIGTDVASNSHCLPSSSGQTTIVSLMYSIHNPSAR